MVNPDTGSAGAATLRSRAEERFHQDAAAQGSLEPLSPEANQLLPHELRVHQIELEMQNEELRRAETALDAARDRYFDLYDLAPVGYCTLSKEGLVLEANLTAATLLGVPRGAMVKQPISLFIHPEDMDLFYLHRQRLLDAGDTLAWDMRMVKKDGTAFWGHLEAGVAQDAEGEDVIRLVVSDVTERVWAARAQAFLAKAEWLTSGEGFFQALARFLADDLGMDYVCIDRLAGDYLEAETLAIWCDGHFEDNVTYALKDTPCGDVVGKSICCFPSGVRHRFPKDQVLQDMTAESYLGVTLWGAKGQPIGLIALIGRHAMADADLAKTTLDLVSLRAAAELERHQAEEALRESEGRNRAITQSAHDAIVTSDRTGTIIGWNPSAEVLFGHTEAEAMGQPLAIIIPEQYRERHLAGMQRVESGGPHHVMGRTVELAGLRKDQSEFPLELSLAQWETGAGIHVTAIIRDVTERKQSEKERQKLQAQLQQSQKLESLGTLAGGVAHDMNNVLGAILGLASAHIGSQPYGSPLHQALDTICKATERGGKMVKSLLGFARQSPAENNRLDMNAILKEQIGFLERTTLAKVRLQMDLEAELRPIQGDASALTHAFMNLCVNAVDAMPESGTLTLHTRNVDNDWIEIEVEDDGMGMSKEVLEKAIDPFFTTKGVGKGTGLGLSMVFSTVKAHRGQMAIESEPNNGTRVRLRFPACKNEIQVAVVAAADATNSHHRTLKVLLVDDDDLIQSSVQAILEVLGHTAENAALSGEEALAMLEAGLEPDLVILDMNMPGLGGFGTLPLLRGLRPMVPVLLSTGRTDETALTLAAAYPGVTILSKPFGMRELQKHLENIGLG